NKRAQLNIEYKNFTSKKLTQKLCDESDFLITMDKSNFKNVLKNVTNTQNKVVKITDFRPSLNYDEGPEPWYSGNCDETYKILT
ncbi:low molecular weight phosphotyrosine protein phosphatase, partial [Campylobacter jejuni]